MKLERSSLSVVTLKLTSSAAAGLSFSLEPGVCQAVSELPRRQICLYQKAWIFERRVVGSRKAAMDRESKIKIQVAQDLERRRVIVDSRAAVGVRERTNRAAGPASERVVVVGDLVALTRPWRARKNRMPRGVRTDLNARLAAELANLRRRRVARGSASFATGARRAQLASQSSYGRSFQPSMASFRFGRGRRQWIVTPLSPGACAI